MKIGGEYGPDQIRLRHFERLAEDADLAKPLVKRRLLALAETILAKIPEVATGNPKMKEVADFIRGQCEAIRKAEIKCAETTTAIVALDDAFRSMLRSFSTRPSSGLVQMQTFFRRLRSDAPTD